MVPIETVFVGMILLFGIIGMLRGWSKELLVSFSVILARFIEYVTLNYVPILKESLQSLRAESVKNWFIFRLIVLTILVAFGYANTKLTKNASERGGKENFPYALLGLFLGFINGYLVVGVIWGFLSDLGYGIWSITEPTSEAARRIMPFLPLAWLEGPSVFVLVAIAFAFVLIVVV